MNAPWPAPAPLTCSPSKVPRTHRNPLHLPRVQLRRYRSGRVELVINGACFEVNLGVRRQMLEQVVVVH